MDNQQIIELFQSRGLVDSALAQDILAEVGHSGKEISEILADFQVVQHRDDIWPVVASELGASMVDLRNWTPPEALLALVPAGTARLHGALPVSFDETGLYVALVDPLNPQTPEDLRFALGREINVVVAPDYLVEAKINECYGGEGKAMEDILSQLDASSANMSQAELESEANSAPIIRYVDLVLYQAIKEKASDIHFEPFEKEFRIRYRVDGALYEMAPPPFHLALPILSRVKVMSNMNIAERRVPQDGRIVKQVGDKQVDMRVSSLPTHHGESIVLRVLDRSSVNLSLENLGLTDHIYNYITDTIEKPNGIFIVTGPTG
ncbi:MAG: pilus assembly protein PilB, partial [Verrucomicrobiaceae bacterium]